MKKSNLLIGGILSATLLLGACSNNEEDQQKQEQKSMSYEEQEKEYTKETKKLGEALVLMNEGLEEGLEEEETEESDLTDKDLDEVEKFIKDYEDNTKHLDKANKEVGDYALKTTKSVYEYAKNMKKLDEFAEANPELEKSYDLALLDSTYSLFAVYETLEMDYEMLDAEYKKEYLGKKGNEALTDILATHYEIDLMELADSIGIHITEYDEELTDEQNKQLSNMNYRKEVNKLMAEEEPDMSKRQYNSVVDEYNASAPQFLHYAKADKMVTVTDYNYLIDLRNGIEYAETDSELDDFDSSESDSNDESSTEEPVTKDNVIDKVEEYEGELLDTETYTYKEPEKTDDGGWGFSFTDENGDLAGSYIVDEDGNVTKYDENGEEEQ